MRIAPNDPDLSRYGLVFVGLTQFPQDLFVPLLQYIGRRQRRNHKAVEDTVFPGKQKLFRGGDTVFDLQIGVAEQHTRGKILGIGLERVFSSVMPPA